MCIYEQRQQFCKIECVHTKIYSHVTVLWVVVQHEGILIWKKESCIPRGWLQKRSTCVQILKRQRGNARRKKAWRLKFSSSILLHASFLRQFMYTPKTVRFLHRPLLLYEPYSWKYFLIFSWDVWRLSADNVYHIERTVRNSGSSKDGFASIRMHSGTKKSRYIMVSFVLAPLDIWRTLLLGESTAWLHGRICKNLRPACHRHRDTSRLVENQCF